MSPPWYRRADLSALLKKISEGCQSLRGSPNELWKAYALKFLDSYAYFSLSIIMTLFLSADFGYSDVQAGTLYGAWGALITIYGLLTGFVVDNLGVAASLRLGFCLTLVSRCWMLVTTSRAILIFNICFLLPLGSCMGIPVLTTGIRRYTHEGNRGFAFGLFYVIMNVAALASGPIVDMCTIVYKDNDNQQGQEMVGPYVPKEWSLTGYRLVILTGIVANVAAVLVAFTVREIKVDPTVPRKVSPANSCDVEQFDDERNAKTVSNSNNNNTPISINKQDSTISAFTPLKGSAWSIFKETVETKTFWRFLLVCLIMLNVRMIFRHLDATLPKYMMREFGDDVPKGTIYSINPALIIILVPLFTAGMGHIDPLVMIHHGSYISAFSVFCLVLATSIPACIAFVVLLSIGEAVWSPRLYDYTMQITPEGREGTYMALSSAPMFLAKLPVGFMSGKLLQKYCPLEGERHSQTMWLIIGLTTISSPILLTVFWKYVSHKDDASDREHSQELTGQQSIKYTEVASSELGIPPPAEIN